MHEVTAALALEDRAARGMMVGWIRGQFLAKQSKAAPRRPPLVSRSLTVEHVAYLGDTLKLRT